MGCITNAGRSAATFVLSIFQVLIAAYIVFSVTRDLWRVTVQGETTTCFLETEVSNESLCEVTVSAVAFTFAISIALSILQCFTCNCCSFGFIFDTALALFLSIIWFVLARYIKSADDEIDAMSYDWNTSSVSDKRQVVMYLSFIEGFLFALSGLLGLTGFCPDKDRYDARK